MANYIERRKDVSPKEGLHEYGDVTFADPTNKNYPIDVDQHVRTAWLYFNHKENAAKYDKDEMETIKNRIKRAAKEHDIDIESDKK